MPSYTSITATDSDQNLAVSSTAVALTLPAYFTFTGGRVNHGRVTIQCRTAPVLFTLNGTAPTAADESTGTKLKVGSQLILTTLKEMRSIKFIRATGTDGAVFAFYEARTA